MPCEHLCWLCLVPCWSDGDGAAAAAAAARRTDCSGGYNCSRTEGVPALCASCEETAAGYTSTRECGCCKASFRACASCSVDLAQCAHCGVFTCEACLLSGGGQEDFFSGRCDGPFCVAKTKAEDRRGGGKKCGSLFFCKDCITLCSGTGVSYCGESQFCPDCAAPGASNLYRCALGPSACRQLMCRWCWRGFGNDLLVYHERGFLCDDQTCEDCGAVYCGDECLFDARRNGRSRRGAVTAALEGHGIVPGNNSGILGCACGAALRHATPNQLQPQQGPAGPGVFSNSRAAAAASAAGPHSSTTAAVTPAGNAAAVEAFEGDASGPGAAAPARLVGEPAQGRPPPVHLYPVAYKPASSVRVALRSAGATGTSSADGSE